MEYYLMTHSQETISTTIHRGGFPLDEVAANYLRKTIKDGVVKGSFINRLAKRVGLQPELNGVEQKLTEGRLYSMSRITNLEVILIMATIDPLESWRIREYFRGQQETKKPVDPEMLQRLFTITRLRPVVEGQEVGHPHKPLGWHFTDEIGNLEEALERLPS